MLTCRSLLPKNSSALERAIESTMCARLAALPIGIIKNVYDPYLIHKSLLKHLAWQLSVDYWDDTWDEDFKRKYLASVIEIHEYKGTEGAIEDALKVINCEDAKLIKWYESMPDNMYPHLMTNGEFLVVLPHYHEILKTVKARNELYAFVNMSKPLSRHYGIVHHFETGCNIDYTGLEMATSLRNRIEIEESKVEYDAVEMLTASIYTKARCDDANVEYFHASTPISVDISFTEHSPRRKIVKSVYPIFEYAARTREPVFVEYEVNTGLELSDAYALRVDEQDKTLLTLEADELSSIYLAVNDKPSSDAVIYLQSPDIGVRSDVYYTAHSAKKRRAITNTAYTDPTVIRYDIEDSVTVTDYYQEFDAGTESQTITSYEIPHLFTVLASSTLKNELFPQLIMTNRTFYGKNESETITIGDINELSETDNILDDNEILSFPRTLTPLYIWVCIPAYRSGIYNFVNSVTKFTVPMFISSTILLDGVKYVCYRSVNPLIEEVNINVL